VRTSNAQRPTLNVQLKRCAQVFASSALFLCAHNARAQGAHDISATAQPLTDGVPQVAVVRLRELLRQKLAEPERLAATAKLAEALVAADEPAEGLKILADPASAKLPDTALLQGQANAALERCIRLALQKRSVWQLRRRRICEDFQPLGRLVRGDKCFGEFRGGREPLRLSKLLSQ